MSITPKQAHILLHALGMTQGGASYRNHFVTGAGSDDHADCMALAAIGLMERRSGSPLTGGDGLFLVTKEGRAVAEQHRPKPKKLTRSQQRYRRFLDADSGLSFREWLRRTA